MLTQKARYALHAMIYLAKKDGSASVIEIAQAENLPRKFLEQILTAMKAANLVTSRRGAAGGYVLARAADQISFADILRCIDGPLALAPCASQTAFAPCPDCKSIETCKIRPALMAVRDTTALLLEGISLGEVAGGNKKSFL